MNDCIDKNIFRAYDIRGVVNESLSEENVSLIGQAIGSVALEKKQPTICVGRDGRLSSPKLSDALIHGLLSTGINVIDIGLVATPMLYFSNFHLKTNSGIMITGSHNPPEYNGFKTVIDQGTLSSNDIQSLHQRIMEKKFKFGHGQLEKADIRSAYINAIIENINISRPIKISIDCGNGAAGVCAADLFSKLGVKTENLFCEVDGTFPNHHPDPSNPKNLMDLIHNVKTTDSEFGLAFDGDADRLGVVTKNGEVIYPDRQLLLFADAVLKENPGATIIFDVKSTRYLFDWISSRGGHPLIWKTGHSHIKSKMKEINAALAGEMSGHTFFNDRWYGFDDGLYAAARLIEILSHHDNPSAVLEALPKGSSTPELNIKLNEGEPHELITILQKEAVFPLAQSINTIDGLRVEYEFGFGLMRASNTTPVIVLRFEADSDENLLKIQNEFEICLSQYIDMAKLPFLV